MLTRRGGAVALALVVTACSSSDPEATTTTAAESVAPELTTSTTVPERPASTTTTGYDPASVEGQVEAAYLRSWDVYAEAVYNLQLDEEALAEVYGDPLLSVRSDEIGGRVTDQRASLVEIDHDYRIEMTGTDTAAVIDTYQNHQVLVDPSTKQPIEPDPDRQLIDAFTLRLVDGRWVVFDQKRLS